MHSVVKTKKLQMNFIKKTITVIIILTGIMITSPNALALWQCGQDVASCSIAPFNFNVGITPACFHRPENIDMAMGWCDILQIISNAIGVLYAIIIPIVTIMIIVGGAIFITAGGQESQIKKGKAFLKSAIIGLIIALGAGVIIGTIIRGLGVIEGTTLMPWLI